MQVAEDQQESPSSATPHTILHSNLKSAGVTAWEKRLGEDIQPPHSTTGKHYYVVTVRSTSPSSSLTNLHTLRRRYEEFVEFHAALSSMIRSWGSPKENADVATLLEGGRLVLPKKRLFTTKAVLVERVTLLDLYVSDLFGLSQQVLQSSLVLSFFTPNELDRRLMRTEGGGPPQVDLRASWMIPIDRNPTDLMSSGGVGDDAPIPLDEDWLSAVEQKRRSRAVLSPQLPSKSNPSQGRPSLDLHLPPISFGGDFLFSEFSGSSGPPSKPSTGKKTLPTSTMGLFLKNAYEEAAKEDGARDSIMIRSFALAYAAVEADVDPRKTSLEMSTKPKRSPVEQPLGHTPFSTATSGSDRKKSKKDKVHPSSALSSKKEVDSMNKVETADKPVKG
ncbi:hypothetical protein HDU67_007684, partial [Dinochytrium kinnereticum]